MQQPQIDNSIRSETLAHLVNPLFSKVYFFHDVRITCKANSLALLEILDQLLDIFPTPSSCTGELTYYLLCVDSATAFPFPLPESCVRTATLRLLTNTRLKYYRDPQGSLTYQSYTSLAAINGAALSVLDPVNRIAITQLEQVNLFQSAFLRRYLCLLALGHALNSFGFTPCHAACITAPWDDQQGALLLGDSGSGKTTLSLGCACLGCGFLSDDLVMLQASPENGSITACAISHEIAVRSPTLDLLPQLSFLRSMPADKRDKRYCSVTQLYAGIDRLRTHIRLLIFPELTDGSLNQCIRLSKGETLQRLVAHCLSKTSEQLHTSETLFTALSQLAEQAQGYRLSIARASSDGPRLVCSLFTGGSL